MKVILDGATILITGASSGIGAELARQLGPRAGILVLAARRTERLEKLKAELIARSPKLRVEVMPCDLADMPAIERFCRELSSRVGPVDVLINNAGLGDLGPFESAGWSQLEQIVKVNVLALTRMTHELVGPMIQRRKGGILMVSSMASFQPLPGFGVYCASKFFVRGLSESLLAELHGTGVSLSQLCPGPVKTEFLDVAKPGADSGAAQMTERALTMMSEISSELCARQAIRGFERGRAVIVPGFTMKLLYWLQKIAPEAVLRIGRNAMARQMKKGIAS